MAIPESTRRLDVQFHAAISNLTQTCAYGGEAIVIDRGAIPSFPGLVYSQDGERELNKSGMCEFHFDWLFGSDDDD